MRLRVAVLAPHVVHYHAPLYRLMASSGRIDLRVLYCARHGLEPVYDPTMNARLQWDIPLLDGYASEFLPGFSRWPHANLIGRINPSVAPRLLARRYDAIVLQDYSYLTSWLALAAARLSRTAVVFRAEGSLQTGRRQRRAARQLARQFVRAADALAYTSTDNRRWLESLGGQPARLHFSPCSVDNEFFLAQRERVLAQGASPKKQLNLDPTVVYVLSVSRLTANKRPLDLVQAVAKLQRAGRSVGLILVGDGPQRPEIEARIRELELRHVCLPGFINQSRIAAYYAAADIFALASDHDFSPKALSEALVFGLPVVCSSTIGTAADLARDGWNGYRFPMGDVARLAECLCILAGDVGQREAMGRNSRQLAGEWSMQAAADGLVEAVLAALERRQGRAAA
jgi:glycosyltransferase involved in cell wall biosynthesis